MRRQVTRFEIRTDMGDLVAVHARLNTHAGKKVWWESADGTIGLPDGVGAADLPLFGSELVRSIPTGYLFVTEGEKDAMALRAGGVQALATVTGAASCPTPRALVRVARWAKFILWPDNDEVGLAHMQTLARNLYAAGALKVRIIRYRPGAGAEWPRGAGAADVVTPATARTVLDCLVEDWAELARRPSAVQLVSARSNTPLIGVGTQADTGSVVAALSDAFGIIARPGKSTKCPMHDDRAASLSVLKDDHRAICHAGCSWGKPGVTASQIRAVRA